MPKTIAEEIKAARLSLGYTQAELGTLLDVSATTIARWERGESVPASPAMLRLALQALSGTLTTKLKDLPPATRQRIRHSVQELRRTKRELTELIKQDA